MSNLYVTPLVGAAGLVVAFMILRFVTRQPAGEGRVAEIAGEIHQGAMVFMRREFWLISLFALVVGGALFLSPVHGWRWTLAFFG